MLSGPCVEVEVAVVLDSTVDMVAPVVELLADLGEVEALLTLTVVNGRLSDMTDTVLEVLLVTKTSPLAESYATP
jgi:hypothetical protein